MKKNIILAYLSITLLSYTSCSKNDEVERLTTEPTMVKTELMTSMLILSSMLKTQRLEKIFWKQEC